MVFRILILIILHFSTPFLNSVSAVEPHFECADLVIPELISADFREGWKFYGRFAGDQNDRLLGYSIHYVRLIDDRYYLIVGDTAVDPAVRNRKIQNHMMSKILEKFEPQYKNLGMRVFRLSETNDMVFNKTFTKLLKENFPNEIHLPNYEDIKVKYKIVPDDRGFFDASQSRYEAEKWSVYYKKCCEKFALKNRDKISDLVWAAARETPAYKTRARLGYSKPCPETAIELTENGPEFYLCK